MLQLHYYLENEQTIAVVIFNILFINKFISKSHQVSVYTFNR